MTSHDDPRLLYSISGVKAYHIQDGEEASLTPSGPQTLSLLMVPTSSQYSGMQTLPQNQAPDQDFYLHLNLPPELDLPMPATTQIYHQPPTSYLIPRWDLNPEQGAFTRLEFPPVGRGPGTASQEDIDTFETILAQCTAFLERSAPPKPGKPLAAYNPADYSSDGKFGIEKKHGQIVLVDEDDGSVVGELGEGAQIVEDPSLQQGSKNPVEIQISADGKRVDIRPISEDYLALSKMPQYQKSSLVQNAAAASRLIVTGSSYIGNMMSNQAENFVTKTKPNQKPLEFTPATHERVRKINALTHGAAGLSSKTANQISKVAQNFGAGITGRQGKKPKVDKNGNPVQEQHKPGILNKSMIAFTTIADGIVESGKTLLTQGGAAASTVVGHKYGEQAGTIAGDLAGGVKNVGLVYIDVVGVTRRAVVKSVAKGMVVGKMKDGKQVIVGGGDGGQLSESELKAAEAAQQQSMQGQEYGHTAGSSSGTAPPAYTQDYYGPKITGPPAEGKAQYRY